jgi:nitrite reductase (NADH) large subunit
LKLEALLAAYGKTDPSAAWYVKAVPLAKPELVAEIKRRCLRSVSAVLHELGNGSDNPLSKPGLASLLRTTWGAQYDDERDARFVNDRVHANIQNDGTFSVVPRIPGGVTSPAQLRRLAEVAEKYHVGMVKITGGQRIDLLGIKKDDLPGVWRDLGMPSGHAYTKAFRTCKTCIGTDFCRYGVGDSTSLGVAIETRYQGVEAPHKMKLAVSGCARNCAEATVKDIGAVAISRRLASLRRWRGRSACPRRRSARERRHPRGSPASDRPFHSVLPRERALCGAQPGVCRARRNRAAA